MAQSIVGRNNYTTTGAGRNTIEDDNTHLRGQYFSEGIISGCVVSQADTPTTGVKITAGYIAINVQDDEFLVFQLKDDEPALVLPGSPSPTQNVRYLVAFKVDLTNVTATPVIIEGSAGTDPELTETVSPKVSYVPLSRINYTTGNVLNAMIVQDGVTQTNNSTPETIGRLTGMNPVGARHAASAFNGATQEIPTGTATKVVLNTKNFDFNNDFNTSLSRFVVRVPGEYEIKGYIEYDGADVISGRAWDIRLYVNGVLSGNRVNTTHSSIAADVRVRISDFLHLEANDYVELYALHGRGANVTLNTGELIVRLINIS